MNLTVFQKGSRKMRKSLMVLSAAAGLTIASASAQASVVYSYVAYQNGSPVSNINLNASGSPTVVQIFLDEALTAGSTSLISADNGLNTGAFSVQETSGNTLATSAVGDSSIWSGGFTEKTGDSNVNRRIGDATSNTATLGPVPTASLISLGFVTITPDATAGVTDFKVWSFGETATSHGQTETIGNLFGAPSASGGFFDIDNPASSSPSATGQFTGADADPTTFTVTVTGAPEPATIGLAAVGMLGLLARRRRKM
jgi:hypothetical protein